jgi:putative DNA methylase
MIYRRKLIEVDIPLAGIDEPSARLKQKAPKGYPTRLHKWWAQTPVPAARAVLFAQLVDDPSAWPDRFQTEADQARERLRLFQIIVGNIVPKTGRWENGLTDWASSGVSTAIEAARYEIARCIAWERKEEPPHDASAVVRYLQEYGPIVFDPFCGSGTIPQEAQRLGLQSVGSDLNPVAVVISKALVEVPPKFAGLPPVNSESRRKVEELGQWRSSGAQGLSEDVRYYGHWIHNEAQKRIGQLYPDVSLRDGSTASVCAWLWARTVPSPNPAANGASVPLVSSFMLSTREGGKKWVKPVLDQGAPDGWRFEVQTRPPSKDEEDKARQGTKPARGANFTCVLTGSPITPEYIKRKGCSGRMAVRLMAIVAETDHGRTYISPFPSHEAIALSACPDWLPEGAMPANPRWFSPPDYGISEFKDLFTNRQLIALKVFSDLVTEAREKALEDARVSGLPGGKPLSDGGSGAEAYADAVAVYLAMAVSRHVQFGSTQSTWYVKDQAVKGIAQQALPMIWDFCEANPFGDSSANFNRCANISADCLAAAPAIGKSYIYQHSAQQQLNFEGRRILVSTDPPYYDNMGYADLSDLFHIWLRRALRDVFPNLMATIATPKADELVATPYRDRGGQDPDEFWLSGMKTALKCIHTVSSVEPSTVYYAYRQRERSDNDRAFFSPGWSTFLQALHETGFVVDGTWALRVNAPGRQVARGTNALASAVILVCRKRLQQAAIATRASFLRDLARELPSALTVLKSGSIAPVDLAQASIGPGMAIFGRYSKILNADDTVMSVEAALQDINSALDSFLSEQDTEYDPHTRFAITWFEQVGMAAGPYGTADTLARARGISVGGVRDAGIVEAGGSRVRLKRRDQINGRTAKGNGAVWLSTQYVIHRLMEGSEELAAEALADLGPRAESAKDLAHRLYRICEHRRWSDDGYAYNALVASWPRLIEQARSFALGPAQTILGL